MLRAASVVALAAASLAGKHHDAAQRRLSEPPDGCALYIAGPVVASQDNQVATVDSLQNYELTFTMELASDWVHSTGDYQSVLHVGDTKQQRLPMIQFRTNYPSLYLRQSYDSPCDPDNGMWCQFGVGSAYPASGFTAGETYEIKVIVENNQMTVYVDGALVASSAPGSATYTATDAAVYVGSPWDTTIAKVTLSDITLSEVALADVCRENIVAMGYIFQAGRCYPQSEAPVINTAGLMSSTLRRTGTPQECYDYCTGNSGFNIMGLDLRPTGGQDCQCNHPSVKSRER